MDLDIFLMQMAGVVMHPDVFINNLLTHFEIRRWPYFRLLNFTSSFAIEELPSSQTWLQYKVKSEDMNAPTHKLLTNLVEDMFVLIIRLVNERQAGGGWMVEDARGKGRDWMVRREILHCLFCGGASRNVLMKKMPKTFSQHPRFDEILREVAIFSQSAMSESKYTLKSTDLWEEFDPYFLHYTRKQQQKALENYQMYQKQQQQQRQSQQPQQHPVVNLSAPPVAPQFCGGVGADQEKEEEEGERKRAREGGEGLTDLLSSGLLHELLFYIVYNVVGEGKEEEVVKGGSYYPLLRETMQLIVLAVQNEVRHRQKLSSSGSPCEDSSPDYSLAKEKAQNFGKLLVFDEKEKLPKRSSIFTVMAQNFKIEHQDEEQQPPKYVSFLSLLMEMEKDTSRYGEFSRALSICLSLLSSHSPACDQIIKRERGEDNEGGDGGEGDKEAEEEEKEKERKRREAEERARERIEKMKTNFVFDFSDSESDEEGEEGEEGEKEGFGSEKEMRDAGWKNFLKSSSFSDQVCSLCREPVLSKDPLDSDKKDDDDDNQIVGFLGLSQGSLVLQKCRSFSIHSSSSAPPSSRSLFPNKGKEEQEEEEEKEKQQDSISSSISRPFLHTTPTLSPPLTFPPPSSSSSSSPPPPLSLSPIDSSKNVHVKLCGHIIHEKCLQTFIHSLFSRGGATSDTERNYFECPVCRALSNVFVPLVTPHGLTSRVCPACEGEGEGECVCGERKGRGEELGGEVKESVRHFGQLQEMIGRGGACVDDGLSAGVQAFSLWSSFANTLSCIENSGWQKSRFSQLFSSLSSSLSSSYESSSSSLSASSASSSSSPSSSSLSSSSSSSFSSSSSAYELYQPKKMFSESNLESLSSLRFSLSSSLSSSNVSSLLPILGMKESVFEGYQALAWANIAFPLSKEERDNIYSTIKSLIYPSKEEEGEKEKKGNGVLLEVDLFALLVVRICVDDRFYLLPIEEREGMHPAQMPRLKDLSVIVSAVLLQSLLSFYSDLTPEEKKEWLAEERGNSPTNSGSSSSCLTSKTIEVLFIIICKILEDPLLLSSFPPPTSSSSSPTKYMGEILGSLFGMDQKEEMEQESGEKQGEELLRPLKRLRVFSPLGENLLSSVKKRTLPFFRRTALLLLCLFGKIFTPLPTDLDSMDEEEQFEILWEWLGFEEFALFFNPSRLSQSFTFLAQAFASSSPSTPSSASSSSSSSSPSSSSLQTKFLYQPEPSLFELVHLPMTLQHGEFFKKYYLNGKCEKCGLKPNHPALCLVCGEFVCCLDSCCRQKGQGEATRHVADCGGDASIYFLLSETSSLLLRSRGGFVWSSPYVDNYGEEDLNLRRGKDLHLNLHRYHQMRDMFLEHDIFSRTSCRSASLNWSHL